MRRKFQKIIYYLFVYLVYKMLFAKLGQGTRLVKTTIDGFKNIELGNNVFIEKGTWLAAVALQKGVVCSLEIGAGSYIGRYCHIYATQKIRIGKKVLIADKVYISDNQHRYKDTNLPVIDQGVEQLNAVEIEDGAWLGENVCVLGVRIGKNSIIGANSVVNKNIPDYCIAAGAPAKIIKRYNFEKNDWCKTNEVGEFI